MKKKLLIFAHRGEAKAFFSMFSLKAISSLEGLYVCDDYFLLLTGEGPWKAGPKVALALGQFSEKISEVINLGIAGSLRKDIEVNKIYPIRTVFLEQNSEMQFASHSLDEKGVDLVTCHNRVLSPELANYLDDFAPTVDRELWSIAQVCSITNHPLSAYKLISDMVGDTEICQRVKDDSERFSKELLDFYLEIKKDNQAEVEDTEIWEGLYFTTSLKNQREKLFHSLSIKLGSKGSALESLDIPSLLEIEETPKKKAIMLIERMRSLLNPVQKELQESLEELGYGLTSAGAIVKFPKDFERAQFHISAHVGKAEDLVALIKSMEEFNYPRFVEIIEGKAFNV